MTFVASLVATGVALPASKPKGALDARITTLENAVARPGFAKSIHTTIASNMLGFDWNGKSRGTLEFRTLRAGTWSNWTAVDGDPAEAPDDNSAEHSHSHDITSAGPVWVGDGVRDVQVRVKDGEMPGLRLHTIKSEVAGATLPSIKSAGADPAWPNVILRDQWGANESWRTCGPDYAPTVRYAVVHHTVNSNNYAPGDVPSIIQGIYYFHTHTNGWCDIGYNFLVDQFGRIWEGRYGGTTAAVIGAHAGGFNTGSTGVAMIGDYTSAGMPAATYNALRTIITWKFWVHRVNAGQPIQVTAGDFSGSKYAAGTVVTLPTIIGHRDVDFTDCPGNGAYPRIPGLLNDVMNDLTNTQPYPYGWYTPSGNLGALVLSTRGGLYPSGSQAPVTQTGFWPGGNVARAAVRFASGGLVADWWGGLHPFGGAPAPTGVTGYWPGQDVVRGIAKGPTANSGYVLDDWGGLHPFGGAPAPVNGPYWKGWDIARAVVTRSDGISGYVLDGWGGIHPFGTAPPVSGGGYWPGQDVAKAIALRPDGVSGYQLDANGGIHPFGGAPAVQSSNYWPGKDFARGIITNGNNGGWVLSADGGVWSFGNAPGFPASLMWTGMNVGKFLL